MKTTIKMTVIAMMGMCLGMNAQEKIFTEKGLKSDFVYKNGNIGIGKINPKFKLDILTNALPYETFIKMQTKDAPEDYLIIDNATGAHSQFIPNIAGKHTSDNRAALYLSGYISEANDTGNNPIMIFDSRIGGKPAVNRPLFSWDTYGHKKMTLMANGNLGIGTTNPKSKLDILVNAGPHESFLKMQTKDAPGDYLIIDNFTGAHSQFIPNIAGKHTSDNRTALCLSGYISEANDTGNNPIMTFDSRIEGKPAVNRPLFSWNTYGHKKMTLMPNGNLGIGTTKPTAKLSVNGKIHTKEVRVDLNLSDWADFVFEKDYDLPTLKEVENHIKTKGHLKDIPSAKDVEKNGIYLGEMNSKLLQKIEELTLYTIKQEKDIKELKSLVQKLLKDKN